MPGILNLPNEILDLIYVEVHQQSKESLCSLSLTCKKLSLSVGERLYQNVSLHWKLGNKSQVARFARTHHNDQRVKSLRIQPSWGLLNGFRCRRDKKNTTLLDSYMASVSEDLLAICAMLSTLTNLATFSIHADDIPEGRSRLSFPVLAEILRALPPSVVSLEIDLQGNDGIWLDWKLEPDDRQQSETTHICRIIGDMIPRLEHLHLHLSCMCNKLFYTNGKGNKYRTAPKLRTCALNRSFASSVDIGYYPAGVEAEPCRHHSMFAYSDLLQLRKSGAFPKIEHMAIVSLETFKLHNYVGPGGKGTFVVKEVVMGTTTKCPFLVVGTGRNHVKHKHLSTFLQSVGLRSGRNDNENALMVFNHEDKLYVGDKTIVRQAMIKKADWEEDNISAVRLPLGRKAGTAPRRLDTRCLIEWSELESKWEEWSNGKEPGSPGPSDGFTGDEFLLVQEIVSAQELPEVTIQDIE